MANLTLTVTEIHPETPIIRRITLVAANGERLPPFSAGAHLKVSIPGQSEPRCYSLVCLDDGDTAFNEPASYCLGVRLEDPSTGGSTFMHGLKVGDTLQAEGPKNDFPLHDSHPNEQAVVLIAGGIGITPIASMATTLRHQGRAYTLHYYGRSREQMAFLQALTDRHGATLLVHADDDPDKQLPLSGLLDSINQKQHVYVCGPKGLIDTVIDQTRDKAWPDALVHSELFINAAPQFGDRGFEVELKQSGKVLYVPADKTILEVLEEAGCDPLYDCRRGECGVCQVGVLAGQPDHRDYYLSDAERDAGDVIQVCISRSHSDRLVLDL